MGRIPSRYKDMAEISFRAARLLRALSNPKVFSLCERLLERGEMRPAEMAEHLGRSSVTVSRFLRWLRDLNVVRYQKKGDETWYIVKHPEEFGRILEATKAFIRHAEENLETET